MNTEDVIGIIIYFCITIIIILSCFIILENQNTEILKKLETIEIKIKK